MIVNRGAGKGAALKRKKCITYVDCSRADEDTVTRWVYATLKRAGVASDVQACRNVAAYCLCDMSRVEGETQKLIEYGVSPVMAAVVDELVYKDADYRVYEMTDAIAARNYSRFLSICAELTRRSSDRNMVVSALHKYFKNLLVISTSDAGTARLAERINADYRTGEQPPVIVGVLTGAFMFCSELIRRITVPCELAFIRLSSYSGTASTGLVREVMGLQEEIAGRDVIVVEDIVETGYSMRYLLDLLEARQPASIRTAVLLAKPSALCKQVPLDYVGMELPEGFLVGFGLDYDGLGRNLPDIYRERV